MLFRTTSILIVVLFLIFSVPSLGNEADYAKLEAKLQLLQDQLADLKEELKTTKIAVEEITVEELATSQIQALSARVDDLQDPPDTSVHLAGYGGYNFAAGDSADDSIGDVFFAPIFHYQYRDLFLFEAELEVELDENGETETKMEYVTLDLFLNDYMTLVGGKFLSPIGQFKQNLHPSWINKLPTAPLGFSHDQAQPDAEVGVQLRGGFKFDDKRLNYAFYLGNGPRAVLEMEDGELEVHALETTGFTSDPDGKSVIGGRIGFLPIYNVEFGLSAATGQTGLYLDGEYLSEEGTRDYDVISADLYWQWNQFQLRSEYVKQKLGSSRFGIASEALEWTGWYSQGAYRFPQSPWEAVVRYSEIDAAEDENSQQQWMLGVNYLFSSNLMAKLAGEFNTGEGDLSDDRLLFQLSYGF